MKAAGPTHDCADELARVSEHAEVDPVVATVVLAELTAIREQIAALTSEFRNRKQRAAKRVRSRRQRIARDPDPVHAPTELDMARARRALR